MSGDREANYEVGYKKPPRGTRYMKGKSGNPNGRPKRIDEPLDPASTLLAVASEEIEVVLENGKRKWMSANEALFHMLFKQAIDGDLKAARLLVKMAKKHFEEEPEEEPAD